MICSCVSTILPFASAAEAIELAAFALQTRGFTFKRRQPVDLHQILRPQIPHALEFLIDQRNLFGLGVLLRSQSGNLLVQLLDALLQLIFLPQPRFAPQVEQLALASKRFLVRRDRRPGWRAP